MNRLAKIALSLIGFVLFFSCKPAPRTLNEEFELAITLHEKSVNQQVTIDSVVILSVDSLTELGYAKLMLEQLENLQYDYEAAYLQAAGGSDEELTNIEMQLQEIEDMCQNYRQIVNDYAADDEAFFLYFVSAKICRGAEAQPYMYIIKQDFTIVDDPFSEDLLAVQ